MDIGSITWTVEADTSKLDTARDDIDRVGDSAKKASKTYTDANGRMRDANGRFVKSAKDIGTQADKTKTKIKGLGSEFSKFRKTVIGVVAAIGAIKLARATIDSYREFETGLIGVAKTTGLAGAELESFSQRIRDLSKTLPVSTNELLELSQAAGQMGVTGSKNIEKFAVTVAKLGRASDLAGEDAAKALARILNVTGEAVSEIDTLASVIVSLGNNVAASESEIARMTTEIARATGVFGVSSAEAAGMSAALASIGVRAELAGSSVGRVMQEITNAVVSGGATLNDFASTLGLNADELSRLFADDKVAAFQYFLEQVGELGLGAGAALDAVGLGGQEIAKTIIPLANNMGIFAKTMKLAGDEVKSATALNKEYEATTDTLDSAIILLENSIKNLGASSDMDDLAKSIRDIADTINNPQFQRGFSSFVSGMVKIAEFGAKAAAGLADFATWIGESVARLQGYEDMGDRILNLQEELSNAEYRLSRARRGTNTDDIKARIEAIKAELKLYQDLQTATPATTPEAMSAKINAPIPTPTHGAIAIDKEAQKAYDKAISSIKDLNLELIYQTEMLGMTDAEMLKYRLTVGDLSDEIELLGDIGINYRDSIIKQAQALDAAKLAQESETKAKEEAKSILDDLKTPMDDYIERLKKITELEQLGELTAEQASRARDKARGDFEKSQQETADKVTDFWKTATENIQNELADNLFDFMQGEFDFSADGFKRMLDRMFADALAADIAGALFPSSLGGEGGGSGLLGDLFNFASSSTANTEQFGGEFAPQSGTTDFFGSIADFFTSFDGGGYTGDGSRSGGMDGKGGFPAMLHPQETVIDHTKGGGGVVVNINVSGVTDEGTLKKTAAQIAQQSGMAAQRATARNG